MPLVNNLWRQEIKYYVSHLDELKSLLDSIQEIPEFSNLFEAYFPRTISNIYFDTNQHDFQKSSLEGSTHRSKIRARWYSRSSEKINVQLEQKVKSNHLGKKNIIALFESQSELDNQNILFEIEKHLAEFTLAAFEPVLFNRYSRIYYATTNDLRLTIDSNISFSKIEFRSIEPEIKFPGFIVEIKTPEFFDTSRLLSLNTHQRKVSKFSIGLEYVR